jgi:hypothetical protein
MLLESLSIMRSQLENYFRQNAVVVNPESEVILANISQIDSSTLGAALANKVVLTLLNIEQEASMKNVPTRVPEGNGYKKVNPPIYVYMQILIAANYPNNYETSLSRLASCIKFFQGKQSFSMQNSPVPELQGDNANSDIKFTTELVSPTFEQLNHIWGMLGGKALPAALYKVRIVMLERDAILGSEEPIKHIVINM